MIIFKIGSGRRSSVGKGLLNNLAFNFGVTLISRIFSLSGALSNYTCYPYVGFQGMLLFTIKSLAQAVMLQKWKWSCSVVSISLRSHGPWNFPSKNTGVGCHVKLCYSPAKKKQQTQNGVMVHFIENFGETEGCWKLCEFWSPRVSALDLSLCELWAVVTSVLAGSQPL